ncbi:tudor and kh domain-containing-like protein [Leptotrombidium deliense]|uniref:Tudor and kh domain-containing-like protein n=1 Tax=Leptotrombidium deliense TaxID=299467 RepID=A0A443SVA4_9ACAR|nr:tudor and kh domain-containing-like protein [Leptotrombidium deliense]
MASETADDVKETSELQSDQSDTDTIWNSEETFQTDINWYQRLFGVSGLLYKSQPETEYRINKCLRVPLNKLMIVHISNFFSPSKFWLHINADNVTEIDTKLEKARQENENKEAASFTIEKNCMVVAEYSKDGCWYRAKVITVLKIRKVKLYKLYFIDYGNIEMVAESNIYPLPEELKHYEPQAVRCSLNNIESNIKWSDETADKFCKILFDADLLMASFYEPLLDESELMFTIDLLRNNNDNDNLINCIQFLERKEWMPQETKQVTSNFTVPKNSEL